MLELQENVFLHELNLRDDVAQTDCLRKVWECSSKMRVFVTGATGFIGSAVVKELITYGHQVLGLARSYNGEEALKEAGAEIHHGSLEDLDSLRRGAAAADGVAHLAFIHDFSKYQQNIDTDRNAIEALTDALADSGKPLVTTFGLGLIAPGVTPTEDEHANPAMNPRAALEPLALAAADHGVRASFVRLPPTVHGAGDHGFVPMLIDIARRKGFAAYVNDGANLWPAVHRDDAAYLYRLAIEKATSGTRLHAIAETGVSMLDIARTIGEGLGIPVQGITTEESADHFGWMARFVAMDAPGTSRLTQGAVSVETSGN